MTPGSDGPVLWPRPDGVVYLRRSDVQAVDVKRPGTEGEAVLVLVGGVWVELRSDVDDVLVWWEGRRPACGPPPVDLVPLTWGRARNALERHGFDPDNPASLAGETWRSLSKRQWMGRATMREVADWLAANGYPRPGAP